MTQDSSGEVLLAIRPSAGRRWVGILSLAGVAVLLLFLVFEAQGPMRLVFLICALAAFFAAQKMRLATADSIELTREVLRTGSGRTLAHVDNVEKVERGAFAFKPSHGFLVKLKKPEGRGWAPGLFWQRGRMLGIGGVIGGGESRAMAEILTALIQGVLPEDALD